MRLKFAAVLPAFLLAVPAVLAQTESAEFTVGDIRIDAGRDHDAAVASGVVRGGGDQLVGELERLTAAGVTALSSQPPTLEDLFLRHYATTAAQPADSPAP